VDWGVLIDLGTKIGLTGVSLVLVVTAVGVTMTVMRLQHLVADLLRITEDIGNIKEELISLKKDIKEVESNCVTSSVCIRQHDQLSSRLDIEREDRKEDHKQLMETLNSHSKILIEIRRNGNH